MTALTRWVLSHKLPVVLAWTLLTIVGFATVSSANNALSKQFSVPGGPGVRASAAIAQRYGNGGSAPPIVPVVTLPHGVTVTTPGI
ncbi:MAG TPA: MMPL family transporter, partial [Chloroflexota bacterium]|nr:MMPL family transporter [Chloroflexota bacterium]